MKALQLPVGRDRKIRTALRANQITGFVTVLFEKKIIICYWQNDTIGTDWYPPRQHYFIFEYESDLRSYEH